MGNINIAELLKDCPKGMELYSPIYGVGLLTKVTNRIHVKFPKEHNVKCFRLDGRVSEDGEIMLFPKGKTTWEGFEPPCKFKDGDIVCIVTNEHNHNNFIIIFKEIKNNHIHHYACFAYQMLYTKQNAVCRLVDIEEMRLATEKEKQKLFNAIKDNGYKWNAENKTLEKLIEPKFKVGDKIKWNKTGNFCEIIKILSNCYIANYLGSDITILFDRQDEYELVPNKFDINKLVPFESRVLVRHNKDNKWCGSFFSHIDEDFHSHCYKFVTIAGKSYPYCIPYVGNEHLLNTTDDCDEYFKTWK